MVDWYCLLRIDDNKYFVLSIILGLLTVSSVEQAAMMALGVTFLTLVSKCTNLHSIKQVLKENKKLLILLLVVLLGSCTVMLAPSQFSRFEKASSEFSSFKDMFIYNMQIITSMFIFNESTIPYCVLFNLFIVLYSFNQIKDKMVKKRIITFAFINVFIDLLMILVFDNIILKALSSLILVITYFINFLLINKHIYNKLFSPLTIATTLMVGSQLMMVVSPAGGFRNTLFGLAMLMLIIGNLAYHTKWQHSKALMIILTFLAILLNINTMNGYKMTKIVDNKNISIINSKTDIIKDENNQIVLYKFPNDNYAWCMPYISKYHLHYFKKLYNIKADIIWEKYTGSN